MGLATASLTLTSQLTIVFSTTNQTSVLYVELDTT